MAGFMLLADPLKRVSTVYVGFRLAHSVTDCGWVNFPSAQSQMLNVARNFILLAQHSIVWKDGATLDPLPGAKRNLFSMHLLPPCLGRMSVWIWGHLAHRQRKMWWFGSRFCPFWGCEVVPLVTDAW